MHISGVIPQLRTTDLAASIHFYTTKVTHVASAAAALKREGVRLVKDVHETPWGTRELVIKDDQGHTLYVGQRLG